MRRVALGLVLVLGITAATKVGPGGSDALGADARERRPNIVLVMSDDQDYRSFREMGAVKRLVVRRGTKFTQNYATYPVCCPSRATLHTGLYAHNHRVLSNEFGSGGGYADFIDNVSARKTLAVRLQRRGYFTGFAGKYLNGYGVRLPTEQPKGWDRWAALTLHSEYKMWGYTLNHGGRLKRYGSETRDYQTDVLARKAASFIRAGAKRSRPFFVALSPVPPHNEDPNVLGPHAPRNPRPAPRHRGEYSGKPMPRVPSFNERDISDKPRFFRGTHRHRLSGSEKRDLRREYRSRMESLLAVDDAVKKLVRTLRRAGELRRTVFVYTSDNGMLLGEHRDRGKGSFYEESTRVPLAIRGPGFPRDVTRSQPVGNIDLAPTFLDLAGAGIRRLDGTSLLPLARDPAARAGRAIVLERSSQEGRAYAAIREGRWVYADHRGPFREMYDLARDPYQLRNVAEAQRLRRVRRYLRRRLRKLKECRGVVCRRRGNVQASSRITRSPAKLNSRPAGD
jgi:N-acetylglucosamine-6-sulfatase